VRTLPPAFLQEPPDPDDVLSPITPFRFAFLIRSALARQPRATVSADDVYSELWERRAELIERLPESEDEPAASDMRVRSDSILAEGAAAAAGLFGFVSFWLLGIALWNTAQRLAEQPRTGLSSAVAQTRVPWLALVAAAAVWACTRWWIRRIWHKMSATVILGRLHAQQVEGDLEDAIGAMVDQICHREDELTRGVLLSPMRAPRLVEFDHAGVVCSQSFSDVLTLINAHVTSAVGIAGTRGSGKSTLLRMLCNSEESEGEPARIGVYLPAPSSPAEGEFVKVIYSTTVRRVLVTRDVSLGTGGPRRRSRIRPDDEVILARQTLERITGTSSRSRQRGLGLTGWGLSATIGGQRTWTERQLSHADWVAEFRNYLEDHHDSGGDPILVAIDELDKIADPAQVINVINEVKDLFHIPGAHFVVSVSDDALRRFATRGIPVRDEFDSSFDTVVEIPHLTAQDSCRLLQARVRLFPDATALFCHAWSGGVPRDLIRVARSCIAIPHKLGESVPITDIAQRVIRDDVREFVDALIKDGQGQPGSIGPLLELSHVITDDSVPLHQQLIDLAFFDADWLPDAHEYREPSDDSGLILSSLKQYLCIAAVINQYFSIPRSAQQWTDDIGSGLSYRDANLFAQAKAALAIHPQEADWRLREIADIMGMPPRGSGRPSAT
jgi:energy-coupling factor transporter ATP-binding protein EcfA2